MKKDAAYIDLEDSFKHNQSLKLALQRFMIYHIEHDQNVTNPENANLDALLQNPVYQNIVKDAFASSIKKLTAIHRKKSPSYQPKISIIQKKDIFFFRNAPK